MTNYADYAYYTGTYGGAVIDTASFKLYAGKATQAIKLHTFNRIADDSVPEEAKMCCCELADALFKAEQEDTKGIASEKVGEHSVTYVSAEAKENLMHISTRNIINTWLAMTGLLYRGCL